MLGGVIWTLMNKFLSQGISFVVSVVLARLLLPEDYGVIAMLNIFIMFSSVLIDAGFGTALIQKKDADDLDYNTVFYGSTFIGLLMYIICYFAAPYVSLFFKEPQLTIVMRVFLISFVWSGYNSVLNAWITKRLLFKKFFYRTLFANILSAFVGIAMAYYGYGVWALIGQSFTSSIVGLITLQASVDWHPGLMYSWERAKGMLSFGSKILIANCIGQGFNQLKSLLIGRMYTSADLALFNKGGSFPKMIVSNTTGAMNTVLFPAMAQYSDNKEKIRSMMSRSIKLSSYIMFFFVTMLIIISEPLVRILYTEKWVGCVPYMQMVCLQLMLEILSGINLNAMSALGKGNTIVKLEIYKKPVFLIMTVIGVYISVFALAVTLPLYAIYADIVNMRPNKKYLGYTFSEQIKDIAPGSLLAFFMFIIIYPIKYLELGDWCTMLLQISLCIVYQIVLSWIFKIEMYYYTLELAKESIIKLKRKLFINS